MRIMLKVLVVAGLLAAQAAGAQARAQTTIDGRVVGPDNRPLADVAVSLGGQGLKAPETVRTGADGAFRFAAPLPAGPYTLSCRREGFRPVNDTVVVLGSDDKVAVTASGAKGVLVRMTPGAVEERPPAVTDGVRVRISTSHGDIDILVDTTRAPVTAANFLTYVDAGLYDGGRFHRATRPDNYNTAPPNRPMMELIQGGINPEKKGQGFPPIPLERTSVTGLKHVRGIVSMARGGPDTATSDFFILLDDQPSLDFGGRRFDDNQGAAAFGAVVTGLDVVTRIQQQPVTGQNLTPPVTIASVKRVTRS